MTAKEMFEKLGYFYDKKGDKIVIFETWYNGFSELHHNEILRFEKKSKWHLVPKGDLLLTIKDEVDLNLFKAINKQVEELGWND